MFRIRSITLYGSTGRKEYFFSDTSYVYGHNNVEKTALTKVIDYALGSSSQLSHAGLDNRPIRKPRIYVENYKFPQ